VIQLGSTKRELIIEENKQEKLVCKPIKFLSPSEKHKPKKTYLILDEHFINNYDILAIKGVLYETSEFDKVNFLKSSNLKPVNPGKRYSTLFFNDLKINTVTKSFLKAFMFGNKDDLEERHVNTFIHSGTMHLFAVSGLHIGCLYAAFVWLFKILGGKQSFSMIITLIILSGYLFLVNFSVSSTRAYTMLCVWVISKLLGLRVINISVVSIAGIGLLLYDTDAFLDIGFLLSITVVLTIIWNVDGKKYQSPKSKKVFTWFFKLLQVNYSAFWGSSLILAKCFGLIVPVSLLSNLFILPFVSIIMPISIFSVIALNLVNSIVLVSILDYLVFLIIQLCQFFSKFSWAYFNWEVDYPINFINFYIYIIFLMLSYRTTKSFLLRSIILPAVTVFLLVF
jgi:competence protein ComEC